MSAAYKRYERYKDSGVEWVGEVPEGWKVKKLKSIFKIVYRYPTYYGISYESNGVIEIRGEMLKGKGLIDIINVEPRYISGETSSNYPMTIVKVDDIVMSVRGTMGKIGLVTNETNNANITANLIRLSPRKELVLSNWLVWLMESYRFNNELDNCSDKTTINTIKVPNLLSISIPLPGLEEQKAISNYLNQKIFEIESLITDKEKLIELLQEKRQAIISEAVTKGLDKNVKMKDSGTPWIGEVPEGWEVKRIKNVAMLQSGEGITSERITDNNEYPVYGGNGLRGYTETYTHNGNYILIGRQGALCGNINYASGKFWASEHAVVVKPLVRLVTLWLGELLRSMNLNQYSVSAAQPGLAVDKIKNLYMPFPSFEEQQIIADFIGQKASEIDSLIQQTEAQIISLIEYRQSLISEVVTGKIMV
jgi:type I restriction enzyme S subunit